jgi:CubicO group peptidase (beta-lactamase class C family)/PKD repeat protein
MKKILILIIAITAACTTTYAQKACCPIFKLKGSVNECRKQDTQGPAGGQYEKDSCAFFACKNLAQTYMVFPNEGTYTYTWQVTGGTIVAGSSGNPKTIVWGNGTKGIIQVIVSNADGSCKDTLTNKICLIDEPTAAFTSNPSSPVCSNSAIQFTNTSVNANTSLWDFGDGTSSTLTNPGLHTYTSPGTYTVLLTVSNGILQQGPMQYEGKCGCTDTATMVIVVKPESGINIIPGCKKMLCKGDTASYCTTATCSSYNWSVQGGTIIGANNGTCINVKWDGSYPAIVHLNAACGGSCGNTASLAIPVLYPTMPIVGAKIVCPNSANGYSLPAMPGTNYGWHLSGGGVIIGPDSNTNEININWGATPGTYYLTCYYKNKNTGCSGVAKDTIKILPEYKIINPILKYCVGKPFSFTAVGAGNWTIVAPNTFTGNGTATINGTWNAPGNYTVLATPTIIANYCSYPATIQVVVNDTPKLNSLIGPLKVCKSSTEVYSISSNMNDGIFNWSIIGGTINSQMGSLYDSVVVTWGNSVPYQLSVTQTVNGCTSSPKQILVDTFPKPTLTGTTNVCAGKIVTYTVAGIPPTNGWVWTVGVGGSIMSQSASTIDVLWNGSVTAGINTSTVSVASCGNVSSLNVNITTPPNVTVTKSGSLACGGSITLSVAGTLPCYQWYRNGVLISGATSTTYNTTTPGYYEVRCPTLCSGFGGIVVPAVFTSTLRIYSNGATEYCTGNPINTTLNIIAAIIPGCTFQWYKNAVAIAGATATTYTATAVGNYYVIRTCGACVEKSTQINIFYRDCNGGGGDTGPGGGPVSTNECIAEAKFNYFVNCTTVSLTDISVFKMGCTITYLWSCPEGGSFSSTTASNPTFTATTAGVYNIKLKIQSSCGDCTSEYNLPITIVTSGASFTPPASVCKNTTANFTTTTLAAHYIWYFGDGSTSTSQNASHTYTTTGTFSVSLVTINHVGCKDSVSNSIIVHPSVTVSAGTNKFVCPGSFATLTATGTNINSYQWYKNGVAIAGATAASYSNADYGTYYVVATSINGCTIKFGPVKVFYHTAPIAKIKMETNIVCLPATGTKNINPRNSIYQAGTTYVWTITGPAGFTPPAPITSAYPSFNLNVAGNYFIVLTATNANCSAKDTICVMAYKSPTITTTGPTGTLCKGANYTFIATAAPAGGSYLYTWNNGTMGNTATTNTDGMLQAFVIDQHGCSADKIAALILPRANVSLFPVGCDTLCLTDTVHFPLPIGGGLSPSNYTIQWYDSGTPVGTNSFSLPLASIGPGDHHFYAVVLLNSKCADTSGTFDLFVKDCTLTPPCDNCTSLFDNATFEMGAIAGNIMKGNFVFTSLKPLKEVRINVADLKYHWDDPSCKNCKATIGDRACIYPATTTQTVGNLIWDNFTAAPLPPSTSSTDCPKELIFKLGVVLPAGTYSIPLQVTFADAPKSNCTLIVDKFCMHLAITSEDCKVCEKNICAKDIKDPKEEEDCDCGKSNLWNNLFLTSVGVGIPKPKTLIFCNSSITGYNAGVPYLLSGMYNCKPGCSSAKYEVVIRNQTGDIIYTHIGPTMYETFMLPVRGIYTVNLTAYCGSKKCECKFQIVVDKDRPDPKEPPVVTEKDPPTGKPKNPEIDKIIEGILPPDFSGQVLVAKKDTILYEKYKGKNVNNHTAFDLASVAKTFTAMAVLKMAEEKKISLSDDVTKYLNNFPINGITIKMLLSHTSGLEDYVKFMQAGNVDKSDMLSNGDLLQYIIKNKQKVQSGKVGGAFNYSNTNFAMLALVIEKISGQSYGQYLSEKFFKPLKMDDTYVYTQANAKTANPSYYKNGKAYEVKFLDFIYGDKNIYTTVKDMMKWDKALRDGKIFSKESIALAYTPGSSLIADQSNYGLGWRILLVPNGKKIIYHNGWWHGNRSVFIRLLDEDAVIIILSNSSFTSINNSRKIADLFGEYKQSGKSLVGF